MSQVDVLTDKLVGLSLTALAIANPAAGSATKLISGGWGVMRALQGFSTQTTASKCRKAIAAVIEGSRHDGVSDAEIIRISNLLENAPILERIREATLVKMAQDHGHAISEPLASHFMETLPQIEKSDPAWFLVNNALAHGIAELRRDEKVHQQITQVLLLEIMKKLNALGSGEETYNEAEIEHPAADPEIDARSDTDLQDLSFDAPFSETLAGPLEPDLLVQARTAVEAKSFDTAAQLLAKADELNTDATLQTKVLRGYVLVQLGDYLHAARHFAASCDLLSVIHPEDAIAQRNVYIDRFYQVGTQKSVDAMRAALWLSDDTLKRLDRKEDAKFWQTTQSNRAAVLANLGALGFGDWGTKTLEDALAAYEDVLDFENATLEGPDRLRVLSNYAVALRQRSERADPSKRVALLRQALSASLAAQSNAVSELPVMVRAGLQIAEARIRHNLAAVDPADAQHQLRQALSILEACAVGLGSSKERGAKKLQSETVVVSLRVEADHAQHLSDVDAKTRLLEAWTRAIAISELGYVGAAETVGDAFYLEARGTLGAAMCKREIVPEGDTLDTFMAGVIHDFETAAHIFSQMSRVTARESALKKLRAFQAWKDLRR